jgi:20S proteasome alpha/beta subunit
MLQKLLFMVAALMLSLPLSFSSSASSSDFLTVRSLDNYGNSVQVSHALEAAKRHGRPVIAAIIGNTSCIDGDHDKGSFIIAISLGTTPILHSIQLPLRPHQNNHGAQKMPLRSSFIGMCCTGLKGDSNWLIEEVQKHSAAIWERYDMAAGLSTASMAHVVARLKGLYAAQPYKREWQSVLGLPGTYDDDRQEEKEKYRWDRPFGVQTMILSCQESSPPSSGLLLLEPSGRILVPTAQNSFVSIAAIGRDSDKVEARLLKLFLDSRKRGDRSSWAPSLETCRNTLIRILLEEANLSSKTSGSGRRELENIVVVEIFSTITGKLERELYRYANAKSFARISSSFKD